MSTLEERRGGFYYRHTHLPKVHPTALVERVTGWAEVGYNRGNDLQLIANSTGCERG